MPPLEEVLAQIGPAGLDEVRAWNAEQLASGWATPAVRESFHEQAAAGPTPERPCPSCGSTLPWHRVGCNR